MNLPAPNIAAATAWAGKLVRNWLKRILTPLTRWMTVRMVKVLDLNLSTRTPLSILAKKFEKPIMLTKVDDFVSLIPKLIALSAKKVKTA